VNRIRLRFDPALKEVLWLASMLEKAQGMAGAVELPTFTSTGRTGYLMTSRRLHRMKSRGILPG